MEYGIAEPFLFDEATINKFVKSSYRIFPTFLFQYITSVKPIA
jgi:hypothetical protein